MNVSLRIVKAALMDAFVTAQAADPVIPLRTYLMNQVVATRRMLATGLVKRSNADLHETIWAVGAETPLSLVDIVQVWVYLVEEFDRAKNDLGGNPSDEVIEAQMEANFRPVFGTTNNFMYLAK